mgnify:FL=1
MKKFSLTHKLLAMALAFVLVAVSLPDYLSFAQQPAQEQSETDEFEDNLADGDPSDDDLSGDNPSDTGEQEMEQQVVLHLQAPETVPMGTAGSFGLSAQNTAAVAADVSIQLTQEEMAAYRAAEQDSTLALQLAGDSLTFTLQPGEKVEGNLSFFYPNGYSSREVVEIAQEDISIVLQQLPEEETGGTPIETIPPEGEIQPPEQGQTPPADETQQPGGEGPTDPSDEGEPTPPESGDGEEATDPSDGEETPPLESGDGEDPTDPSDGGEPTPPESGDGEEATDPSDGENETLPPESGDGEEATDPSNEEETTPPDDETDPSVGEGGVMPSDEQEQVLQTVEQSTVSLTQDYQTGPDGELSEEPTTDSEPADESGTTENEGSTEPSGSESGNPTDLENTGSTDPENTGGDNSSSSTEDGDQQGNDPTGSQGDGQQSDDLTGSQGDGQQSDDLTGSQDDVQQDNDPTGSQDESGQEQPQVSFDIAGATLTFTASFGWGELTLTAQPLETEQQEAAAQETVPQPDLSYTIEAASQNRETTGTIYTRSWSLQQVIALPQGASFVEGEAAVDGNQIRIGATPVLSVDDQSGTAGELSAQRDGETLLVTYTKTLSDWQSLEAESISDLGLAMTLHQEAIVRDESFNEGQVDVGATFTATPVTAAAEIAPAAVLAVLDTGDEQQDGSQSVTQQGSLSLPLSGEQQPEQPQSGDADKVEVTYSGTPIYTDNGQLAVQYTITVTNNNTADPEIPGGGEEGDEGEEQPEGSDGAVKVKIVQNLNEWFSGIATQDPSEPAGTWNESAKTLTWENVEIEAGKNWTRTVTVLIDTDKITSLDALPTDLTSSVSVYDATAGEPGDEQKPIITEQAELPINLKAFVGSAVKPVEGETKTLPQNVHWRDNNDLSERPTSPQEFAGGVCLQFYIGDEAPEGDSGWTDLTTETMGQLGLTAETLPQVTTNSAHEDALWELTAQVPAKIQYGSGTVEALQADVHWRIVPPKTPSAYYFHTIEGSSDWYYLKKQEVTFNIDFRDAVYDEKITADQVEDFLRKNFTLYHEAGADTAASVNWDDVGLEVEGSNGNFTLKLENAVYYTINNEVVHYYLLANSEMGGTIPINEDWPGNDQGDSYRIEYDNHDNPNVGTVTDKVYSGGTLVLTREGTVEYNATKIWITPENRKENRPDGYFELYRYTYPGGSYQTAAPVHGVETVPFAGVQDDGKVVFKSTDGSELELPKYDPEGNRYVYVMKEVLTDTGEDKDSYEQIFGKVSSDGEVVADSDQGPPEDVREGNWERESNDNYVYNGGTITNRIDEQKTVSVTKEWDASSFQAGLGNVEVEMTLYERVKGSTDKWVKSNPEKIIKMDEFSAVNASMSGSTTVPTYNALGQEMEYRFFETKITQEDKVYDVTPTEQELQSGEIEDKKFELTYNGNTVDFISKQPTDTDIGEGSATIVNSIQDEITYTIDKIWVPPLLPQEVSFALYQQGQGQVNTYVGTVTLDNEVDTADQSVGTLTVGEGENQKTYNVTYKVTETGFTQLVIEGLPRYDEHGYSYEYIIVEMPGEGFAADYETTIDESGNYTTIVTNAPGEGHRILVRKRWIDNSDVQHREPVTITAYYADDGDFKNDKALGSVTLGAPSVGTGQTGAWYDYISLQIEGIENFDLNKVYIRETAIGDQTDVDTDEDSNLEIPGNVGRVDNQITDRIDGEHHTYEVTYSIATLSPGQDGDGGDAGSAAGAQTFYVATNRRLGNIDMTVTKDWSSSTSLLDALKNSDIVPVVKLVVDTDKTNAEPPGEDQKIEDIINYKDNTITLTNEPVPIQGQAPGSKADAIQPLIVGDEPVEELYFFNLPKYDKDGRVANYTVEELWTTKKNIEAGKIVDPNLCFDETKILEKVEDSALKELLEDLTVTVTQESYTENDGNHTNDTQTIAITNKLSGTKSIEFHKQWNDTYAFDSGKRPDLYLTLYQLTGDNLITEYREYHWDKSLQTEEGEGGQQGQGEETEEPPQEGGTETQAQDNYYWTCIFENLPKYDENGNEIFYYAVENLAVTDPSTFHYAKPEFQYNNQEVEVEYGEDGKVALPDNNTDKQTGQEILKVVGDKVALLENGTFLNNLEEDVTINGVKLWANLPLTASEADLPDVTFEVLQYSSDENSASVENGTLVAQLAVTSETWKNPPQDGPITANGNQYTFTIDEVTVNNVEGLNKGDPLPLYDEDGRRYTYTLEETLGTADDDPNVDWTLVYHNETFNEYQITNTYDPQLGALSVKKLLEVEPYQEHYPSIRFRLYQVAPDSAGKYDEQNAVLYREESWSSEDVEKAIGNTPSVLTTEAQRVVVEETFTFKNLPIYAPNGEKYQYFVAEILDDRSGYEMNYEAAVVKDNVVTIDNVFNSGDKKEPEEGAAELATEPLEVKPNKDWSNGSNGNSPSNGTTSEDAKTPQATFGDRYRQGEITLKGTKKWDDQSDALGLRPEPNDFKDHVKLYRYAEAQEGQNNAIEEAEVTDVKWTWVTTSDDDSQVELDEWTYTIEGTDGNPLEQYAPNGMPWIYIVRENLAEMDAGEYIPTNQKTIEGDKIGEVSSDKGTLTSSEITMPELKNSLTTAQSFQKKWQNHDGDSIIEDYLGLGDITITGQLWVGEKDADGNVSNMQKASEYFTSENGWIGPDKWWDEKPTFTVDLKTQLGDNDQTATISNLPRVNKDSKELVYAIVEEKISLGNGYSQEFSWNYADGKLTVTEQKPQNCLFTPQEVTVNENSSTTTAINSLETKNLSVEKLWKGDENETNLRPLSVDVVVQRKVRQEGGNQSEQADELTRATLMAPRTTEDGWEFVPNGDDKYLTETLEEATGWKASIPNLPSYGVQDGALVTYEYRIRELRSGWQDDDILNEDDILKAGDKYNPYYTVSYDDNAHTVTNTLTHMDIIAVKEWKPGTLTGENAKVIFTLQSRVGDGEWTNVDEKQTIELDGTPDQDGEFEAWKARWTELPRTDSSGAAIEYLIKETLASDLIENEHVTILYPEKGITGSTADKTYTVTNIPLGQITVTKEDGDGNGLAGVEFTLNSDSGTPMPLVGKTGEDGKLTFTELPLYDEQTGEPITYTLTESATPDGHIRLEQPIEVSFTAQEKPVDGIYWQTTNGFLLHEVAYEVVNGQYFPVVHTGGSGFYWPGVLGAGAAAAGVLYLIRRKTKGHNTER